MEEGTYADADGCEERERRVSMQVKEPETADVHDVPKNTEL